jgi:hypothetical protein
LASNMCSQRDAVLSVNISNFVVRGMEEKEGFLDLEYAEQIAIITPYIEEVLAAAKANIIPIINTNPSPANVPFAN